ncbi:hypothetical protein EDD15DRAFT_1180332 [Pisolithus albus]|nr:hypothetical protein EDD15DRAFT_1180332 [Pisolithus albus]
MARTCSFIHFSRSNGGQQRTVQTFTAPHLCHVPMRRSTALGLYSLDKVVRVAIVQVKSLCHKAKVGGTKCGVLGILPESKGNKKSSSVVTPVRTGFSAFPIRGGRSPSGTGSGKQHFPKKSAHLIKADEDIGVGWTYGHTRRFEHALGRRTHCFDRQ